MNAVDIANVVETLRSQGLSPSRNAVFRYLKSQGVKISARTVGKYLKAGAGDTTLMERCNTYHVQCNTPPEDESSQTEMVHTPVLQASLGDESSRTDSVQEPGPVPAPIVEPPPPHALSRRHRAIAKYCEHPPLGQKRGWSPRAPYSHSIPHAAH